MSARSATQERPWRARAGLLAGVLAWWLSAQASLDAVTRAFPPLAGGSAPGIDSGGTPEPPLDLALGGLAGLAGLIVLGWFAVAAACSAAAAALPAGSAVARGAVRAGERVTPLAMRRALTLVIGAALASSAVPAQASTSSGVRAITSVAVPASAGSRTGAPRPGGLAPRPPAGPAAATVSADLDPGWFTRVADLTSGETPRGPRALAIPVRAESPALDPSWGPPGRGRPGVHPQDDVVVRRGDTLWDLAARHLGPAATDAEIARAWPYWFTANRAVIGPDPDVLKPGQRLIPPDPASGGAA